MPRTCGQIFGYAARHWLNQQPPKLKLPGITESGMTMLRVISRLTVLFGTKVNLVRGLGIVAKNIYRHQKTDTTKEITQLQMASGLNVPKVKLNDGSEMPAIALGTFLGVDGSEIKKSENKQLRHIVLRAIDIGYRHIDTAAIYGTEEEIGEALTMRIKDGDVTREEVFLTTKLWNTDHRREKVIEALERSLKKLNVEYVDLYLMHWPIGLNEDYSHSDVDFMETWRGMEDAKKLGLAKSIGLSNFNKDQINRVISEGTIPPAALQIEIHPQLVQEELVEFAQSKGIVVMGYSPFGTLVRRYGVYKEGPKMDNPDLVEMAGRYNKTVPQLYLRWQVDRGLVPVAKSLRLARLVENISIFDFHLEQSDIELISGFDSNTRLTVPAFWQNHPYYPFEKIDIPNIIDPFIKKVPK